MSDMRPERPPIAPPGDLFVTLISAGLFLYVGFALNMKGVSGDALYDGSVAAFTWGARIAGFSLLVTAALSFLRLPGAALLDLAVAAVAAAGCLAVGLIWLLNGDSQGLLLLLFGVLNGSALRAAWCRWRITRGSSEDYPA